MASSALRIDMAASHRPLLRLTDVPQTRSAYRASGKARPWAAALSVAAAGTMVAAITWLNVAVAQKTDRALTVVSLTLMPSEPPPPPPAPMTPQPPARAAVVAPVPVVRVPAPEPPVAVTQTPSPPVPVAIAAAEVTASGPSAAPPASPAPPAPVDAGDLSAKMIAASPPTYPVESRRRREQGIVKLAVLVGRDGRVEEVSVSGTSGSFRLDRAALSAVRRWRWSPVIRDGAAVMVRGFVTIPFVLQT